MNINSYKLSEVDFNMDEWELIHTSVFLRENDRVNLLEISIGRPDIAFALFVEFEHRISNILSIDPISHTEKGEKLFYQKTKTFTTIHNRGLYSVGAAEIDIVNEFDKIEEHFSNERINILSIEFINNDEYMDKIMERIQEICSRNLIVIFHHILKSNQSERYFKKLSVGYRHCTIVNNQGIGIIWKHA